VKKLQAKIEKIDACRSLYKAFIETTATKFDSAWEGWISNQLRKNKSRIEDWLKLNNWTEKELTMKWVKKYEGRYDYGPFTKGAKTHCAIFASSALYVGTCRADGEWVDTD